jgi:hypothetical protein
MIVRTMRFFAPVSVKARFNLEEFRMKFLLFPSVRESAFVFKLATIFVRCDKVFCMPILAHFLRVGKETRFSSIVLPVVSVDTDISFMVIFSVRTPNCLKMKDIEIHVRLKLLYQLNG